MLCRNRQFGISGIPRKALGRAMGPASESEGQWQSKQLVAALQDRKIDLELSLPVLVGGGAQLMEKYLRDAIPRKDIFVIPDVRANAIGYEVFANRILKERQKSTF